MILNQENQKDIQKYYQGSYVKYPSFHGDKLFYVKRVNSDTIEGTHIDEDGEDAPYLFYLNEEECQVNAEFLLPRKSFFMYSNNAYLLYRKPSRQYKKGICDENTSIVQLRADGEFDEVGITWKLLQAYVGKNTFCMFDLTGQQSSYALSPRIAVAGCGSVFVDRTRIGSWSVKEQVVVLKNDLFVPEMLSILRNSGQKIGLFVGKDKVNV